MDFQPSALQRQQLARDEQSQPRRIFAHARRLRGQTLIRRENPREIRRPEPWPAVAHFGKNPARRLAQGDNNFSAPRSEFQGVADQIIKHLSQPLAIGIDTRQVHGRRLKKQSLIFTARDGFETHDGDARDFTKIMLAGVELQVAVLHRGRFEKISHESAHAGRVRLNPVGQTSHCRRIVGIVPDEHRRRVQRRQRDFEIVRSDLQQTRF